ncbi:MAG: fucose isomerase [Actinomycetia bacterium]|nr:fucose isomerase [Actinomycetes bacterium]
MTGYTFPTLTERPKAAEKTIYTVASGDLRLTANVKTWAMQQQVEQAFAAAVEELGWSLVRAHGVDPEKGHGFIDSQRRGMDVFATIPSEAPLVVVEAVWQYSHHVLAGLRDHRGPILVVANFAGDFPGLVGLLNLTGSMTKAGIKHSALWSKDFTDDWAKQQLKAWLETGEIVHDTSHVRDLPALPDSEERRLGEALAEQLRREKAIMAVFDEGCMGMYNAIFDDELLNPTGIYKERLSQSALYAEMLTVTDEEAAAVRAWLEARGMTFHVDNQGDWKECLTDEQLTWQLKMYIAAVRIADDFGADVVGIQYQQGLKDMVPASDLAEGLLNDPNRPPVTSRDGSRVLYQDRALPHFNEVDQGVAVDALVTNRVWTAMGLDPSTTLHDIRWGDDWEGNFVWVLEISGSVPASHLGGYQNAHSYRQSYYFFPKGGGTLSGVSKPGELVWSRVFLEGGRLHADLGRGSSIEMPEAEVRRRLEATNREWPILNAILHGVSRDQLMARHKANHLNVVYAPDAGTADRALVAKAAMLQAMGLQVHLCGDVLPGLGA